MTHLPSDDPQTPVLLTDGERLALLRLRLGMNYKQLAAELKVSRDTISDAEHGRTKMLSPELQQKLRDRFSDDVRYQKLFEAGLEPHVAPSAEWTLTLNFYDGPNWPDLFRTARSVDIFFSGGANWRAHTASLLDELFERLPADRIRVVLPDLLESAVMQLGRRYGLSDPYVRRNIADAWGEFLHRGATVRVTDQIPRYALYRFGPQMVVTLYNQQRSHSREVPTLILTGGPVVQWFRDDFEKVARLGSTLSRLLPPEEGLTTARRVLATHISNKWELPPRGKFFKAFTVIGADRIRPRNHEVSEVESSTGKQYVVRYDERHAAVTSNDGGSFFRGYLNYPIIAELIRRDRLSRDEEIFQWFAHARYAELSALHNRDYYKIDKEILRRAGQSDAHSLRRVNAYIEQLKREIELLGLSQLPAVELPEVKWRLQDDGPNRA